MEKSDELLEKIPLYLQDMRMVYAGQPARTTGQLALARMFQENPQNFLNQLRSAEKEYRSTQAVKLAEDGNGLDGGSKDDGSARAMGIAEEWLKQNGVKEPG